MTDHALVPGKKTIRSHLKRFIAKLHDKGCTQVDQVSISHIREKCIGESSGILFIELVKICLPEKIDKGG
jgi:hypothetical protein